MALSEKLWARALSVTIVAVAGLGLTSCSLLNQVTNQTERDETGAPVEGNDDADAFSIEVGDCLNDSSLSGTVTTVPIVPCEKPHDSEAYHAENLPDGDFPGDDAVAASAEEICYDAFTDFIGVAYEESMYDYSFYLPTEDSWNSLDDREVLCTAYDPSGTQVTGTLAAIGK